MQLHGVLKRVLPTPLAPIGESGGARPASRHSIIATYASTEAMASTSKLFSA